MEDKRELTKADKANLARISKLSKADKDKLSDWEKEFTKNQAERFDKFKDKGGFKCEAQHLLG